MCEGWFRTREDDLADNKMDWSDTDLRIKLNPEQLQELADEIVRQLLEALDHAPESQ